MNNNNYNLPPEKIYYLLKQDFESMWNCLAQKENKEIAKGNFNFALLDMILLEFISRYCSMDETGKTLEKFSNVLYDINKKYFIRLPLIEKIKLNFSLPYHSKPEHIENGKYANDELLWLLFDLIRNGEAHNYQEIIGKFEDGHYLLIAIPGPKYGETLDKIDVKLPHLGHLGYEMINKDIYDVLFNDDNDVRLYFMPEIMFKELIEAVEKSEIFKKNLNYPYFGREIKMKRNDFTAILFHSFEIQK
jgi:hypothetical protein